MLVFPATFDPLEMGVGTDFYKPVPHSELEKNHTFPTDLTFQAIWRLSLGVSLLVFKFSLVPAS